MDAVLKTWSPTHFERVLDNWKGKTYMLKANKITFYVKNVQAWSISGLYFIVFELYIGKYGPRKSPY